MDYIRDHLDGDLSLATLASVAGFSPFHFHRMFKDVTGETVGRYTRRARLERAVDLLQGAPSRSLASIGAEVGFTTPSEFSRVFKASYGIAPSRWDRTSRFGNDGGPPPWRTDGITAGLVRRPAYEVVSIRIKDPWVGENLSRGYDRLRGMAADLGLRWAGVTLVGMSWESGTATPIDRLVYDLGMASVVDPARGSGQTGHRRAGGGWPTGPVADGSDGFNTRFLPAVTAAEVRCRSLPETGAAWQYLYRRWLPRSGFEPADHPAIKFFVDVPDRLDPSAWHVDCSIAVRRAKTGI